jgi:hypothetical protein
MRIRKPSAIVVLASLLLVLALVAGGGVVFAQPTITGVDPDFSPIDSQTNVTITGSGFIGQQNVTDVCFGAGILVNDWWVLSDTQIVANCNITSAAVAGPRDVTVWVNATNSTTLPRGFYAAQNGSIRNPRVDSEFVGMAVMLTNTTSVEIGCGRVLQTRVYSQSASYSNWFRYEQYSNITMDWVLHEQYLGNAISALGNTTVERVLTGQPTSFECNRKNVQPHYIAYESDPVIIDSWVIRDGAGICQRWVLKSGSVTTDSWQTYEHCTSTGWEVVEGPHTFMTTVLPPIAEEYGDPYACPSPGGGM